jgi:hypothetical protein
MQRMAAMLGQSVAEPLPDRAKCDAVDDCAVAGFEPHAHMGLAHFIGIHQLMRRQCHHRLRIAAAERGRRDCVRGREVVSNYAAFIF